MRKRFELVHVEHLISSAIEGNNGNMKNVAILNGNLKYTELLPINKKDGSSECLLGSNECVQEIRRIWERINSDSALIFSGQIELQNIVSFGPCGLLLDFDHDVALVGGIVNWGEEYARWYINRTSTPEINLSWSSDRNSFEIDLPEEIPIEERPGILMSSPGQDIFGHWLLDYTPRLMLASLMHGPWINNLFFNRIPGWVQPILEAFGITESKCLQPPQSPLVRYKNIAIPSGTKNGFRVSQPISQYAWLRLKYMMLSGPISELEQKKLQASFAERIFVSRKAWGSSRVIENALELEDICRRRGYTVVRPEEFSLPAQARLFNQARIVVGEDGSGLHNIIFCEPGCHLGVASVPDRFNLWHMSFAKALGHFVSYTSAQINPDGKKNINANEFTAMLDQLESCLIQSTSLHRG